MSKDYTENQETIKALFPNTNPDTSVGLLKLLDASLNLALLEGIPGERIQQLINNIFNTFPKTVIQRDPNEAKPLIAAVYINLACVANQKSIDIHGCVDKELMFVRKYTNVG